MSRCTSEDLPQNIAWPPPSSASKTTKEEPGTASWIPCQLGCIRQPENLELSFLRVQVRNQPPALVALRWLAQGSRTGVQGAQTKQAI